MTDKATLLALAERVEAATGTDEGLDREVAAAVQDAIEAATGKCPPLHRRAFTASLDAALSLEPDGLESEEIYPPDDECPVWTSHIVIRGNLHSGTGNTRVLAQLASRLRARAETQP